VALFFAHFYQGGLRSMSIVRVAKTRDYTVMSNHHLRNANLSLKAKGLLSLMLTCKDDWQFSARGLAHYSKDSVDSIRSALRELEEQGYVVRQRVRNANGQLGATAYTVYEHPRTSSPEPGKPERENPVLEKPEQENATQSNTNIPVNAISDSCWPYWRVGGPRQLSARHALSCLGL
jgi:hypothetical protein